jgi:hypothetical protein
MMRFTKLAFVIVFCAVPLAAQQPSTGAFNDVVGKIVAKEHQEMSMIRERSPIVETYIQKVRNNDNNEGWQPDGDHYFIGRAELGNDLKIESIDARNDNAMKHAVRDITQFFTFGSEFLPKGFLQMIFLDNNGLDTQNYSFDYVRREFLGEVRTLVFDVTPNKKSGKGRFIGRIWVEDQDYTIVHYNGSYSGHENSNSKFHFDAWRVNAGPNLWLPAFIYSEEDNAKFPLTKAQSYKAQTRLWGYNVGHARDEQELSTVLIESQTPVVDKSESKTDLSPVDATRAWDLQAQDNVMDRLQSVGLLAPKGNVDKILDTVVNNLEVTNNLNLYPEVRCRVLMTSTIESFSIGSTIVLSRGLIDVLPDEASLAAVLAKELGYIELGHKVDTRYAFADRFLFLDEKKTFQHFDFERSPQDEAAASAKAADLLKNSPYKAQLGTAEMFLTELRDRSREIPNLISPRLGDDGILKFTVTPTEGTEQAAGHIVALPLGGRVKLDPWNDSLDLLNSKPVGTLAEREKLPFQITPFVLYLTRVGSENPKTSQIESSPHPGS